LKLLLDQHISYKLAARLEDIFPGTSQVRLLRLEKESESEIWHYARTHKFVIVTKDSDLVDLAVIRGAPPKIVWLRIGNTPTSTVEQALGTHQHAIEELARDESRTILEIVA
jgi:predicted nuclease of predicted toxin-antitoxin system